MAPEVVDLRQGAQPPDPPPAAPEPSFETPAQDREAIFFAWEAPEFRERLRNRERWVRTAIFIAVPLALLFLLLKNVLGAIVTVLAAFTVLLEAFRKPRRMRFAITEHGVEINDKRYPYRELESFWIFADDPNERMLSVKTKRLLRQYLPLPLGLADPDRIHAALEPFLPEEKQERSAFDALMREIGF